MNIAALGNIVPQLHLHHVARYINRHFMARNPYFGGINRQLNITKKNLKFRIESLVLALSRKGYNII